MFMHLLSVYFTVKSKYEFKVPRLVVHILQCLHKKATYLLTSDQSCLNWIIVVEFLWRQYVVDENRLGEISSSVCIYFNSRSVVV